MGTIYKDYLIVPIFHYNTGKTDFEVFPDSGNEPGYIFPYTTEELVKEWIDEKIEDNG